MTPEGLDDVLPAARLGEPWALRRLYDHLAPQVHGYLRARGAAEPDELTNDVFLGLFRRLPDLEGGMTGLRTLTFSIAHARLVDDLRAQSRRPPLSSYDPGTDARSHPSAEQVAEDADAAARARALLARLPAEQASVLALRMIADLSLDETAEAIGRSRGAVQQLQRRALIALKSEFAGDA